MKTIVFLLIMVAISVIHCQTPQGDGYFGEYVPRGMSLSTTFGEYRYFRDDSTMMYVPGGTFTMGDAAFPNSQPIQKIEVSHFYIDRYEVTVNQYQQFCYATKREMPTQPPGSNGQHPVVNVSWEEANLYAQWIGKSLPTEAQWEKAARGGHQIPQWGVEEKPLPLYKNPLPIRIYTWGNTLPNAAGRYRCNYRANDKFSAKGRDGHEFTAPGGSFVQYEGSVYGCSDLCGNVQEWCADFYVGKPKRSNKDPKGPTTGTNHVIRGGGWNSDSKRIRVGYRTFAQPDYRSKSLGFRLVKNLDK